MPFGKHESDIEFHSADGVFVKRWSFSKYDIAPQHSHTYDHLSMVATGSVRLSVDGEFVAVFRAPAGINIKAGHKHEFFILEDNTTIYCIHNISRTGEVDVAEEHDLTFGG